MASTARTPGSGSRGFNFWLLLLIVSLGIFVANFFLGQQLTATVSQATANASRLQVTALRIAGYADRAARSNEVAFEELSRARETGGSILGELDAVKGSGDSQVLQSQETLAAAWGALNNAARQILDRRQAVVEATL